MKIYALYFSKWMGIEPGHAYSFAPSIRKLAFDGKEPPKLDLQADIHKMRKLVPYQNVFYLRRFVNALEGETGELFGAKGSTTRSFGERTAETLPAMKESN